MYIYTYTHTYIYIYVYIYTYRHTYIHKALLRHTHRIKALSSYQGIHSVGSRRRSTALLAAATARDAAAAAALTGVAGGGGGGRAAALRLLRAEHVGGLEEMMRHKSSRIRRHKSTRVLLFLPALLLLHVSLPLSLQPLALRAPLVFLPLPLFQHRTHAACPQLVRLAAPNCVYVYVLYYIYIYIYMCVCVRA